MQKQYWHAQRGHFGAEVELFFCTEAALQRQLTGTALNDVHFRTYHISPEHIKFIANYDDVGMHIIIPNVGRYTYYWYSPITVTFLED